MTTTATPVRRIVANVWKCPAGCGTRSPRQPDGMRPYCAKDTHPSRKSRLMVRIGDQGAKPVR